MSHRLLQGKCHILVSSLDIFKERTLKDRFGVRELKRNSVIQNFVDGIIDGKTAAADLGLSYRQVLRLKKDLVRFGAESLKHGNIGRRPSNRLTADQLETITNVYWDWRRKTDIGINAAHLTDILEKDYRLKLSRQTVWRIMKSNGMFINTRKVRKFRKRRERRDNMGDILYLDGSPHRWMGDDVRKSTLIICSDDATSAALWGVFAPEENRNSCFEVVYEVFKRYGLPSSFWLDRASQFVTTRGAGQSFKQTEQATHWQNAMYNLGIRNIFAHSPQARGRGERLNGTFQGRLCAELQYHGIKTDDAATKYLNETFIPDYNRRFAVAPKNPAGVWRKPPVGYDLRNILSARYDRRVLNDNTVKHDGRRFQLEKPAVRSTFAGRTVEVQIWYDGSTHVVTKSFENIAFTEIPATPRYKRVEGLKVGTLQSDIYRQTYF